MARTTIYTSVLLSETELRRLDAHAARLGLPRNRVIRNWIATLPDPDDIFPPDDAA